MGFTGIGRYTANLLREMLDQLDEREYLFAFRNPWKLDVFGLSLINHPRLQWLDVSVEPLFLSQQWISPLILKRAGIHVYHSPYCVMPYISGARTVVTVHDLIPMILPERSTAKSRLFYRFAVLASLLAASTVIVDSRCTARDIRDRFGSGRKLKIVPLGVDARFHPRDPDEIARWKEQRKLPSRYCLYFGSDRPNKNRDKVIGAWAPDAFQRHGLPLVLGGGPPLRGSNHRNQGPIHCLGPVEDHELPLLYAGAELFVFPSLYEGFGLPVLEAMAAGVPVVCSKRSSLPEVGGDAAVYLETESPACIADTVTALLQNPDRLRRMRERGLERAAWFTWARTAAMTLDIYRRAVGLS